MNPPRPISRGEIIGLRITRVSHVDLPFETENRFQPRLILVQLENGLKVSLQQKAEIIDPLHGEGLIFPYDGPEAGVVVLDSRSNVDLASPVRSVVQPYGWLYSFGLTLENGFVLHDGFSSEDNGALFYQIDEVTEKDLAEIRLPNSAAEAKDLRK